MKKACRYCGFEASRHSDEDCPAKPPPFPHKYTLLYRPPSFASLPPGTSWVLLERPRIPCGFDRRTDLPISEHPFGVIAFSKPLSEADVKAFELKPL